MGFDWVDEAKSFRSAGRFGAAGSSPDFSRVFHDIALLGLCLELSFIVLYCHTQANPPSLNPLPSAQSKIDRIRSMEKTSLAAKLLDRATLILRYYVIRVLRNTVAASNHIVGIEFFVETTSVFFLVFFLALHTDRVKERTVMVMSWTRMLLQGFLWPWTMVAVTWLTAMSVRVQLQSGRAPATRREGKLGRTRRRRWRGVTSGVANTCAEDEKQPWVNGEKKFVYHGARWLGSHARRWRCEKWSGRGYRLFKTEGKDPGKQSSSEDDLADELQHV